MSEGFKFNSQPKATVWITGAHGFIGRNLARHLAGLGNVVYGLGHGLWPLVEAQTWGVAGWVNGDINASNLEHLRQKFGKPDVIYHLAGGASVGMAISNPFEDFRRTVFSTAELLEWMRQHVPSSHLVAVSSAAVYGAGHVGAISEEAKLNPFSPYGTHKFVMEEMCRSYANNFGLRVAIPRLFSVYGAGLKKQLLWDLCNKLALGGDVELGGTGDELRDWIDVRDVVHGLERVASFATEQAQVVNLAHGRATPVKDIAMLIAKSWRNAYQSVPPISFSGNSRPGDPFSLMADVSSMSQMGITNQVTVEAGIDDYVRWYCTRNVSDV